MTQQQIADVMKFHLSNFNNEGETIKDDLVLNKVLSDSDGFGPANSQNIFRAVMRWTFKKNGHKDKPFPRNWMDLTVSQLASKLVIFLMLICSTASAQISLDVKSIKTVNENNAIEVGISYVRSLDSMFKIQDILIPSDNSLFAVTPEFDIRTGTADAFSSITAKITGMFMTFGKTVVNGIVTPNTGETFHVFPLSLGIETHSKFTTLNMLAEAGYVPWYQVGNTPNWLKQTKIGFFLQGGYKMGGDSATIPVGGQVDESKERVGDAIFRFKTSAQANINTPVSLGAVDVGLVGSGDLWLDIVNRATYYRYDATVRFFLTRDKWIDLVYQKGSGAPNFNQGDQYGVGLTLKF